MKNYPMRMCNYCNKEYQPTGPAQRFCCRRCKLQNRQQLWRDKRAASGNPVGKSGGNYGRVGTDHWAYKNGILNFQRRLRYQVKSERRYCERCGRDLQNVNQYQWCVHHRDHDRTHNTVDNLELLCKSCHQIEHECWRGLPTVK